jgi:hypothetical protein
MRDARTVLEPGWKYEAVLVDAPPASSLRDLKLATRWTTKQARTFNSGVSVIAHEPRQFQDLPGLQDLPAETFHQITWRSLQDHELHPVIIACWPSERLLADLDTLAELRALCVLPSEGKEVLDWRVARRAIDLLNPAAPPRPELIADPVVRAAMKGLTIRVNHGTMLTHWRGKAASVQMIQILRRGGHEFAPAELRTWAVSNGWTTIGAAAVSKIADEVSRGHALAAGSPAWPSDILDQWRAIANSDR